MSKTEKRNHSEVKLLRERLRDLESENRKLKRRLRQHEKRTDLYEDNKEEIHKIINKEISPKIEENYKKLEDCLDCGKGKYEEFEIMEKVFGTCNICGHRKKLR